MAHTQLDFSAPIQHISNPQKLRGHYPDKLKQILSKEESAEACAVIREWDAYEPTPLYALNGLAAQLGVDTLLYKDEGGRFGLGSFKALGGAYAVLKYLQKQLSQQLGEAVAVADIMSGKHSAALKQITVTTATAGNHGKSVAWGARLVGCACQIYLHKGVSQGREDALSALGATVVRVDGTYDDSVRAAAKDAKANGWHVISDTSYDGYMEVPRYIMSGYTILGEEILDALEGKDLPTHIFLQGGVGGLASALCAYFWAKFGPECPRIIVAEPGRAPCLALSAMNGKLTTFEVTDESIMAGLSCGEPSMLSWEVLQEGVDDFVTITDDAVPPMMRLLAKGTGGDPSIVAGESAVAGLAALYLARQAPQLSEALDLDAKSRILLIGTEAATDPEIYASIMAG